jgi:hypothetical protein
MSLNPFPPLQREGGISAGVNWGGGGYKKRKRKLEKIKKIEEKEKR